MSAVDRNSAMESDWRAALEVPGIPQGEDGPIFREPWEAQAFAMALSLHQRGLFTWPEWAATLADEIKRAQAAGDPDTGDTYYLHWLNALAARREGRRRQPPSPATATPGSAPPTPRRMAPDRAQASILNAKALREGIRQRGASFSRPNSGSRRQAFAQSFAQIEAAEEWSLDVVWLPKST